MRLRSVFGPLALLGITACSLDSDQPQQKPSPPSVSQAILTSKPVNSAFLPTLKVDKGIFYSQPSSPEPSRFLKALPQTYYVRGHKAYCDRNPADCKPDYTGDVYLPATPTLHKLLEDVNLQVNKTIKAMSDNEQYGDEFWTVPQGKDGESPRGDCDDYAMTKRSILEKYIPKSSMSLAFVDIFKDGAYKDSHAILIVHTLGGDMVLDNLSDKLRYPSETGYVFRGMSDPRAQSKWNKVEIPKSDYEALSREYFASAFNYQYPRVPTIINQDKTRYAEFESRLEWQIATGQKIDPPVHVPFAFNR